MAKKKTAKTAEPQFKKVGQENLRTIFFNEEGDTFVGRFVKSEEFDYKKGKKTIKQIKHLCTEYGTDEDVELWGFGLLNYLIKENVKMGQLIKVVYTGKKKVKGQAQPLHQCDLFIEE